MAFNKQLLLCNPRVGFYCGSQLCLSKSFAWLLSFNPLSESGKMTSPLFFPLCLPRTAELSCLTDAACCAFPLPHPPQPPTPARAGPRTHPHFLRAPDLAPPWGRPVHAPPNNGPRGHHEIRGVPSKSPAMAPAASRTKHRLRTWPADSVRSGLCVLPTITTTSRPPPPPRNPQARVVRDT